MKAYLLICSLLLPVLFMSCDDDGGIYRSGEEVLPAPSNIPAIASTRNSFSYALNGAGYTVSQTYSLDFLSANVTLGVTINAYKAGKGTLELTAGADTVYYSLPLNGNAAIGNVFPGSHIPKKSQFKVRKLYRADCDRAFGQIEDWNRRVRLLSFSYPKRDNRTYWNPVLLSYV